MKSLAGVAANSRPLPRARPPGAIERQLGAAHVHVEEVARRLRRMDDGCRVEHRRGADAVEQRVQRLAAPADQVQHGAEHLLLQVLRPIQLEQMGRHEQAGRRIAGQVGAGDGLHARDVRVERGLGLGVYHRADMRGGVGRVA